MRIQQAAYHPGEGSADLADSQSKDLAFAEELHFREVLRHLAELLVALLVHLLDGHCLQFLEMFRQRIAHVSCCLIVVSMCPTSRLADYVVRGSHRDIVLC